MQSKGWVKLWREQFSHHVSSRKPWCDGYAWSFIYSQANYQHGIVNFRNQYIPVERGQFLTSILGLSKTFGWTRKRVRAFLTALENEGMIERKSGTNWDEKSDTIEFTRRDSRFCVLSICNYEKYQSTEEEEGTPEGTPGDHQKGHQKGHQSLQAGQALTGENGHDGDTRRDTRRDTIKEVKKERKNIYCETFETLSAFLSSLPEYLCFSLQTRELILEFINRVRAANKTKCIAGGRVSTLLASLKDIQDRTDEESLLVGLRSCFDKEKRDGFDFGRRDPTAYARAVAKSHKAGKEQKGLEAEVLQERKGLTKVPGGKLYQRLEELVR